MALEFKIPKNLTKALKITTYSPKRQQLRVLKKLLKKARFTEFGQKYRFDELLLEKNPTRKFQEFVPTYNYNKIYDEWWHKTLEGKPDICWPGVIKFFALSSGTSESASKYIPITKDIIRSNKTTMVRHFLTLAGYQDIPVKSIGKGWLMLGGTTDLQKGPTYYAGDLSGISATKVPFWFQPFYKPGKVISKTKDWNLKLDKIVEEAPNWDIGFVVGVPAWIQMVMEKIIERYNLKTIHDVWPNLAFFVHGGVAFEPYKKGFERLLAKPLTYIETYLASEGFIAYQDKQYNKGMKLVTGNNIFFEFVPFDDQNFDSDGNMAPGARVLLLGEVDEGRDYAILLSTNAGTWRYLIGDTVRFVDKKRSEIVITGRTKHFLSLVGEHLSVDNMNKAVNMVAKELNLSIPEYTVAGEPHDSFFAHHWYVACDEHVDKDLLRRRIDETLKDLNDDYAVERDSALKGVFLDVLPEGKFMEFLRHKGKVGGQHKFPRVLKGKLLQDWREFLKAGA